MNTDASSRRILNFNKTKKFLDQLQEIQSEGEDEKYRRIRECKEIDKMKSTSFIASKVKIGLWEKLAATENDIIAKFYFNRKVFVWEILHKNRKFKMETSWNHISAIRAAFHGETTSLFIELEKPPAFSVEADIVPQRHTNWEVIRDFTHREGLKHRWHTLTFKKEFLEKKHYEKIIYSTDMLYLKSCAPFPSNVSPFFDDVPNNMGGFLSYDPQLISQCFPNQTCGNFASPDQQQALMIHPLNQIPQDNTNLRYSSTITNMDVWVEAMQSQELVNPMPTNSASNFQPNYTSAERNSSFDGNIPLQDNRDQILPMVNQIEEQPIRTSSTPATNVHSQRVNVDPQAQFYVNASFLGEIDQLFQPQGGVNQVDVGENTTVGVQDSLVANGVHNQTEEAHGHTSWSNREDTLDDDEYCAFHYLHHILDPSVCDQLYPMHFACANDCGPNRQFLEPSVDMRRIRNEHQG